MIGVLNGISADNVIKESEIKALEGWIEMCPDIRKEWPTRLLIERISKIRHDGIVTENEKTDFLETIKSICGNRFIETGVAHGLSTEFCAVYVKKLNHKGSNFCFTGKFISGPRATVESWARHAGANTLKGVSGDLNWTEGGCGSLLMKRSRLTLRQGMSTINIEGSEVDLKGPEPFHNAGPVNQSV